MSILVIESVMFSKTRTFVHYVHCHTLDMGAASNNNSPPITELSNSLSCETTPVYTICSVSVETSVRPPSSSLAVTYRIYNITFRSNIVTLPRPVNPVTQHGNQQVLSPWGPSPRSAIRHGPARLDSTRLDSGHHAGTRRRAMYRI